MAINVIYKGNDTIVRVSALKNAQDDTFINDAAVTATLKDSTGTNVSGQSWPLTLGYIPSSDGIYEGILEDVLVLTKASNYTLLIDAVKSNIVAHWEVPLQAALRKQ